MDRKLVDGAQPGDRQAFARLAANGMVMVALLVTGTGLRVGPTQAGELFSNPADGYELRIPRAWEEMRAPRLEGDPAAGVRRFHAPDRVGVNPILTISVGDPDGTLRICDLSCREVDGQVSLDVLEETLTSSPEAAGWRQVHGDKVLGGEAARFEHPNTGGVIWAGDRAYYHLFALHDLRPVVLSFDYWPVRLHRLDGQTIDQIIESFRFLEPAATDFRDANSLVQFSSQDDGYQLTIPAGWIEVPVPSLDGAPTPGVQRFESGTDHPYGALTISVGQADETLVVCKPDCEEADGIESVADLRAAIHDLEQTVHETPYGLIRTQPTGSVVRGAATLGGEVAEYQRPQAVIDRQAAAYHVYALHDGRPVLLSFGLTSYARVSEIIDSFRFTD